MHNVLPSASPKNKDRKFKYTPAHQHIFMFIIVKLWRGQSVPEQYEENLSVIPHSGEHAYI